MPNHTGDVLLGLWQRPDFDDDGDGKKDEDWHDGEDNDGDGKIDEDGLGTLGVSFNGATPQPILPDSLTGFRVRVFTIKKDMTTTPPTVI